MRLVCETAGLGLVRHTSSVIAAATGAVAIGDLSVRPASAARIWHSGSRRSSASRQSGSPAHLSLHRHRARDRPRRTGRLARARRRAGYYDQAHFCHDFRTFTGLTPTRYLDLRRRFLREHPGHALDVGPLPAD
jgi:hypothetical protein